MGRHPDAPVASIPLAGLLYFFGAPIGFHLSALVCTLLRGMIYFNLFLVFSGHWKALNQQPEYNLYIFRYQIAKFMRFLQKVLIVSEKCLLLLLPSQHKRHYIFHCKIP